MHLQDAGQRWRQRWHRWSGQLRVPDVGSRILLAGLGGLLLVLLADTAYLAWHEHLSPAVAFFEAARVIATVGPASPSTPRRTTWSPRRWRCWRRWY